MKKPPRIKQEDWGKSIFQLKSEIAEIVVKLLKEKRQPQATYKDDILTRLEIRKSGLEKVLEIKKAAKKAGMNKDLFAQRGSKGGNK